MARRTYKSPVVQNQVLARALAGQSKRRIARELGVARDTVTNIQNLGQIGPLLEEARAQCVALIPKAIEVVDKCLDKESEGAAFRVLEGTGVLGDNHATPTYSIENDAALQSMLALMPTARPAAPSNPRINGDGAPPRQSQVAIAEQKPLLAEAC
jgi:hypothetical protein